MSRPTVEITEDMEAWARWVDSCLPDAPAPRYDVHDIAFAILAAIPEPPRPLAVGDVVDRWESYPGSGPSRRERGVGSVKIIDHEHRVAVIHNDGDASWTATPCRLYRVGESEPAPWPWEVAP